MFKVKEGIDPIYFATKIFGLPCALSCQGDYVTGEMVRQEYKWKLGGSDWTVSWDSRTKELQVSIHHEPFGTNLQGGSWYSQSQDIGMDKFIESIKKPWVDWSEEEIMEKTCWPCLLAEETGTTTATIHSMMVMESYKNPNDQYVKRYFSKDPVVS